MGYPLVPGYETVGRVASADAGSSVSVGDRVFVSGASCYGDIRGLFGGASSRLVVDEQKLIPVGEDLEEGVAENQHMNVYQNNRYTDGDKKTVEQPALPVSFS